jgi:plasmid stability protein
VPHAAAVSNGKTLAKKMLSKCDSIAINIDMPQILIRQLNSAVVRKLRAKAAAEGVSAEEEARRILRRSLIGDVPAMPLIDFLRTMPDADDESIFRRRKRKPRKVAL